MFFQTTGRRKVSPWTANGPQRSSLTSWTQPEHRPGKNGKQTERLPTSPFLTVHENRINHLRRRRQRRGKLVPPLSSHDGVAVSFRNMDEEAYSTHISYIVFCIILYNRSLGHFALYVTQTHGWQNVPRNADSITIHAAPSSPALHRFPMPSLPISRQIALGFFPPLHDLFATLCPVKPSRLWVQTLLPKYVHHVLDFRVPVLLRSFLGRERKEQGLGRVERDSSVMNGYPYRWTWGNRW